MKRYYVHILVVLFGFLLTGCSNKSNLSPDGAWLDGNMPRLIVSGCVTDDAAQPLQGIRVDLYGVREETEPDVLSYNYAFTDSAGMYIICRYLGREVPNEVTVVATDPKERYNERTVFKELPMESLESLTLANSTNPTLKIEANITLTLK